MSVIYLQPSVLGLDQVSVPGSGNFSGKIIPWRSLYKNFSQVHLLWYKHSGTASLLPRVQAYLDVDGTQNITGAYQGLFNPAFTDDKNMAVWSTDAPRSIAGSPQTLGNAVLLVAPFLNFRLDNSDASPAVWSMHAWLID